MDEYNIRSWLHLARTQIDLGLQASDVAAGEEGELYALMQKPEKIQDAKEPIFAVRTAMGYWLVCAADGSAAPDVGGIVGGEHLDRDAAGHSDDDLKNEIGTYYFVAKDEDLAAAEGLLLEGEEEAEASAPAPAAGAPAEPAPGAAEPAGQGAATSPTETMAVPGAAAGALGEEEEEEEEAEAEETGQGGAAAHPTEVSGAADGTLVTQREEGAGMLDAEEVEAADELEGEQAVDVGNQELDKTRLGAFALVNHQGEDVVTSATIITSLTDPSIPSTELIVAGDDGSVGLFLKTDLEMQTRVLAARAIEDPLGGQEDQQASYVKRDGNAYSATLYGPGKPLANNPGSAVYTVYKPHQLDQHGRTTPFVKGGVFYSALTDFAVVLAVVRHYISSGNGKGQMRYFIVGKDKNGEAVWCVAAPCPAHGTRTTPRAHQPAQCSSVARAAHSRSASHVAPLCSLFCFAVAPSRTHAPCSSRIRPTCPRWPTRS